MLLVDDDDAERGEGQEQRRTRAHDDPRLAVRHGAPDIAPPLRRQLRMPFRGVDAEAPLEALQPLRAERDFRQQDQRLPPRLKRRRHGLEIDFGLARPGYAIEQRRRKAAADGAPQRRRRLRLRRRQRRAHRGRALPERRRLGGRQFDDAQRAGSDKAANDPRADAGAARQFGLRLRRAGFEGGQHSGALRRQARRRGGGADDDACGPRRFERRRRAHRHAQHRAPGVEAVFSHPIDEGAERIGHRRRVEHLFDVAKARLRHFARRPTPHDADNAPRPQRRDDETAVPPLQRRGRR